MPPLDLQALLQKKIRENKPLPACTKFTNPIYMQLKDLYTHVDSWHEQLTNNIGYWRGEFPLAELSLQMNHQDFNAFISKYEIKYGALRGTEAETIQPNRLKFEDSIVDYQEFYQEFSNTKDNQKINCYPDFSYLVQASFCKNNCPEIFMLWRENFLQDLKQKGSCYTHMIVTPCPTKPTLDLKRTMAEFSSNPLPDSVEKGLLATMDKVLPQMTGEVEPFITAQLNLTNHH